MATIVLVPGTTAGGWVWRDVTPQLRAAGHIVHTPTLTGLGERKHLLTREVGLNTHIIDIVNTLIYRDLTDVVLAGHSYAGMVIAGVADRVPERIKQLIYLDALVPQDGESLVDLGSEEGRINGYQRVMEQGDGWLIPLSTGPNDKPGKNTPHPYKAWTDKVTLTGPLAPHIKKTYVRFGADKQPGSHFTAAMAESWARVQGDGWQTLVIDTVHQIMAEPQPKADVLLKLLAEA